MKTIALWHGENLGGNYGATDLNYGSLNPLE